MPKEPKEKTKTGVLKEQAKEEMERQRRNPSYPPVVNATPEQLARALMRPRRKKS